MRKFNKTVLLVFVLVMIVCTGFSIYLIDWEMIKSGTNVIREIRLSLVFLGLTFFFMVSYIKFGN